MADHRVDSKNDMNANSKAVADIIYAVSASWSASIFFGLMKCLMRCKSFCKSMLFKIHSICFQIGKFLLSL